MPRHARVVIPGLQHHITQRGNNRLDVFFVDGDRVSYISLLREQCEKHGVRLMGYCLMTNHVHLIAVPAEEDSLHLAVGRTHFIYTQRINQLHGRSGHLWQGRFHSCAMDEAYTVNAMRYIERNPVAAGIVDSAWGYRWSSAAWHAGRGPKPELLGTDGAPGGMTAAQWREFLDTPTDDSFARLVRQ